jgi:hypothetical protein
VRSEVETINISDIPEATHYILKLPELHTFHKNAGHFKFHCTLSKHEIGIKNFQMNVRSEE